MSDKQAVIDAIERRLKLQKELCECRQKLKEAERRARKADDALVKQIRKVMKWKPVLYHGWQYTASASGFLTVHKCNIQPLGEIADE